MAEYNYRDHIQDKTRLRDKNCCLRYPSCKMGKKKNEKKNEMYHVIVLGFNDTSTLEGHFVSSPREREKRGRRE